MGGEIARRSGASYGGVDHRASGLAGITDQLALDQARDFADFRQRFGTGAPLHQASG